MIDFYIEERDILQVQLEIDADIVTIAGHTYIIRFYDKKASSDISESDLRAELDY